MKYISLDDPRSQVVIDLLNNVLGESNCNNIEDYLTNDILMTINGRELKGIDQVKKRIDWISNNTYGVTVTLEKLIISGDYGFEGHITESKTKIDNKQNLVKFYSFFKFRGNKICHFEGVVASLIEDNLKAATSIE
ncbi:nuclear transport factor 2 family protein [Francisella sp. 19X1-34]|uniref:nuclear transport factor 2 family protein n=1 Tax=Francisella sp. 19X1-34 TaxID=3087177 RepID=UPI002E2FD7AE|nr:nuclear transport factor 2 family protein [Francisella sp. 19X1-34]MED7789523.1 nuclear transport factor 2 family protein [Francisella sp. 19X1-34]